MEVLAKVSILFPEETIFLVTLCKVREQSTRGSLFLTLITVLVTTKTTFGFDNALYGLIEPTNSCYTLGYGLL